MKKDVLYTFLDILTALTAQLNDIYDSMSHPITLAISQEQLIVHPQVDVKNKIQQYLS